MLECHTNPSPVRRGFLIREIVSHKVPDAEKNGSQFVQGQELFTPLQFQHSLVRGDSDKNNKNRKNIKSSASSNMV